MSKNRYDFVFSFRVIASMLTIGLFVLTSSVTAEVVERYKDDFFVQTARDILEREIAAGGYSEEDRKKLIARSDLYKKEINIFI